MRQPRTRVLTMPARSRRTFLGLVTLCLLVSVLAEVAELARAAVVIFATGGGLGCVLLLRWFANSWALASLAASRLHFGNPVSRRFHQPTTCTFPDLEMRISVTGRFVDIEVRDGAGNEDGTSLASWLLSAADIEHFKDWTAVDPQVRS